MTGAEIEAWRRRKADIVERHGGIDAATAPCEREKRLLAAVAPWRQVSEGWTLSVDGWRGDGSDYRDMPPRALRAIMEAYLVPPTFAEAKAEADYWESRNAELRDVLSEDGTYVDETALDLVAEVRAAIVRDLALYELPVSNLVNLRDRCTLYREAGADDARFVEALLRDIAAMAEAVGTHLSISRTGLSDRVGSALSADPTRSDRDIARALHCSPTSVAKTRAAMGLKSNTRAVSRGGQRFEMRLDRHPVDQPA